MKKSGASRKDEARTENSSTEVLQERENLIVPTQIPTNPAKRSDDPYAEIWKPHRYKVWYGGRGAGKSFAIAEALIAMADLMTIRVLCCRETQNSIKDSSYAILKDTAERLGVAHRFLFLEAEIRHVKNGSRFLFKGLGHNEQSIKSTEGVDVAWCEEAQSVSQKSWEVLIPTIRKEGSEIWVSFNPMQETDPTYKRFVLNPPPDAYIRKVNYDENPYFPDVLRREMEWDKANDYEKYLHVWEGYPLTHSKAQIFNGKWSAREFDPMLWKKADRLFFGADFGFSEDPSTLIRCFMYDKTLYIDYEAYGMHVETTNLGKMYRTIPEVENNLIYADSARPETISYLAKNEGFHIRGAKKWKGDIKDGIEFIRGFREIVIHPRCKHMIEEARLYSYKVDKMTEEILPIPQDKNNHCLAKGTLIVTHRGYVPIEDVRIGDRVATRYGFKPVIYKALTGRYRKVLRIRTETRELICTPDHLLYCPKDKRWHRAENFVVGVRLFLLGKGYPRYEKITSIRTMNKPAEEVYDLTVADAHEFFANDILVHNCWDAVRYALFPYIRRKGVRLHRNVVAALLNR